MSCPPASPSWILMENHRGICFLPSCCAAGWWMERCGLLPSSLVVCSFYCVCVTGWGGAVAHPWMRSCPAPARCLCIRRHKESFQWALLSFRAFVSWELIVAGGVQGLAVQSFFHRKILGKLDSKIRTVWPFLRRGAACTGFCYENSWSFQERKSFLCLILLVWFSFGLCIKGQLEPARGIQCFSTCWLYLHFLTTKIKCSKKALWLLYLLS